MKTALAIPHGKESGHRVRQHATSFVHERCAPWALMCLLAVPWGGVAGTTHFFRENLMLPPAGMYVSTSQCFSVFANGVVLSNVAFRTPSQSVAPPPREKGASVEHAFYGQMEMALSGDGGLTFAPVATVATMTFRLTFVKLNGDEAVYDGEVLALDFQPVPQFLIRESPTLASLGQTRILPVAGGYMIDSFFDVFLEASTDLGGSWWPAAASARLELKVDPALIAPVAAPRPVAPMPNGQYVVPPGGWQGYANGVVIRKARQRLFTQWQEPPPFGVTQAHIFDSQVDFQLSMDGGANWTVVRAPGTVSFDCKNAREFAGQTTYEMLVAGMTVAGGGLPAGVMLRESPTKASEGGGSQTLGGGGGASAYQVSSFFDIYTEVSTDAGGSWWPATNGPMRAELARVAAAHEFESDLQPTPCGQYVAEGPWFSYYALGIVISNLTCRAFSGAFPPPPPGQTTNLAFSAEVDMMISFDGGGLYSRVVAPGTLIQRTTGRTGGDGLTAYYDTEMLQLDVSGGGLSPGVCIRESPTRASLGRTTATALTGGGYDIDSFFDIYTEVSVDGGSSWWPTLAGPGVVTLQPPDPLAVACPSNVTVRASARTGAVVSYPAPTVSGGCPPVTVTCAPPSGSLFPLGVTTVSCVASDVCFHVTGCTFTVTVLRPIRKHFFREKLLPPPGGMYFPPETQTIHYANGLLLRAPAHRLFGASVLPPPSPGGELSHAFGSRAEMEVSLDGGLTWIPFVADALVKVHIANSGPDGSDTLFATEMQALDISGGTLPPGVMVRESPTLASLGETRIEAVAGGYMIDSFFDIYTEVSVDGGLHWSEGLEVCSMELKADPALVTPASAPRTVAPMPNGQYVSPQRDWQSYTNGVMIRNLRNRLFTLWLEPPLFGASQTHTFDSQLDFQLSMDGGSSWAAVRAPGSMSFGSKNVREFAGQTTCETGVTRLDIAGGDLPAGVMIRESPTRASEGGAWMAAGGGGGGGGAYAVSSFFDIYTEVSVDGGGSWRPATNGPARLELERIAPAREYAANLLPPTNSGYVSPRPLWAFYSSGIVLSNVVAGHFTASFTPPLPGETLSHTCGAQVEMELSADGGATWQHASAPATLSWQTTARLGGDGVTAYYDTEMTQLDISGGAPAWLRARESPTRASLGRTTATALTGGGYDIDSFFDIYTEVSVDGGQSWMQTVSGPGTLALQRIDPLQIVCPEDISVRATNWNGRAVAFPPPGTSGGVPPVTVTCAPPSGSVFPPGETLVECAAVDFVGESNTCAFTVKVVSNPEIDGFPASVARLTLLGPTGGSETVSLAGISRMEVYVGTLGEAEDSDGDGLDDVAVDLAEYALRGYSSTWGAPVVLRRARGARTAGQHEERANNTPGTLDVPPFTAAGDCDSFFDIFLEIEVGGAVLHPASSVPIHSVITHKPPAPGETYASPQQFAVPLLTEQGQPSGITLTGLEYTPSTTDEVDPFAHIDTFLTLRLPSGFVESVRLTGAAKTHVYFEGGEGQAVDNDCDGLDEVLQQMTGLALSGVCSEGPISLSLALDPISLGQLEEQVNTNVGLLDVQPFAATGMCDSFFDVFYVLTVGGQAYHNVLPWRLAGAVAHKPPRAGELLISPPESPVAMDDEWGRPTQVQLVQQWLVLGQPDLDIESGVAPAMLISWPDPSTGYLLRACTNLVPPCLWLDVTNVPLVGGGRKTVTLERAFTNQFFKLYRPLP